ncbi:peptidoglycan-associated lipoprotein, partial [Methylobacterium sp. IIF4SW-B5]|nr:peptidoglycan-associated lipoprotein [Methylobacterium ajmalii]
MSLPLAPLRALKIAAAFGLALSMAACASNNDLADASAAYGAGG